MAEPSPDDAMNETIPADVQRAVTRRRRGKTVTEMMLLILWFMF